MLRQEPTEKTPQHKQHLMEKWTSTMAGIGWNEKRVFAKHPLFLESMTSYWWEISCS